MNQEFGELETRNWKPELKPELEIKTRNQNCETRKQRTRNWKTEIETRNWKPETENWKPETRNCRACKGVGGHWLQ